MSHNYQVCNCKKVSRWDIEDVLQKEHKFQSVLEAFDHVKEVTHCSTGCGGCHSRVLDVISDVLNGGSYSSAEN